MSSRRKKDYYKILGVNKEATASDIKKAYRKLAKKWHPDAANKRGVTKEEAEDKFKDINESFAILSDENKRHMYDRGGNINFSDLGGFSGFGGLNDIFSEIFGFGGTGRGRSGTRDSRPRPERGADLQYGVELTLEEASTGTSKTIELPMIVTCPTCTGTKSQPGKSTETCSSCKGTGERRIVQRSAFGQVVNITTCPKCRGDGVTVKFPCTVCKGKGKIRQKRRIRVNVPVGTDHMSQQRIRGEGRPGKYGGPDGDLYLVFGLKEHEFFAKEGSDLICEVPIGFATAALGGKIDIPLLSGGFKPLDIPSWTQTHSVMRIKGEGFPSDRSGRKGDLYVKLIVQTPKKLSKEQKIAIKTLLSQDIDISADKRRYIEKHG